MGWGEATAPGAACCREDTDEVCVHGVTNPTATLDTTTDPSAPGGLLKEVEATVADLTARLELVEVAAAPTLAWVPATRTVRRFTEARHELATHGRDEIDFLVSVIDQQARELDIDMTDGRSGVAALAAVLAASEHVVMLGNHGRMDPAIAEGVRRVLVTTAIALSSFAPEEVRHP